MQPETAKPRHYKELLIWKKGMEITSDVYRLTSRFPAEEKYGLASQMRRAAVSVPSNIAEGQARHGTREFLLFLSHASGSLAELETQLLLSMNLSFCGNGDASKVGEKIGELQRMIVAIRRKLSV
jgi:four helix bundle protein